MWRGLAKPAKMRFAEFALDNGPTFLRHPPASDACRTSAQLGLSTGCRVEREETRMIRSTRARILLITAVALICGVTSRAAADGWSLWHPLSSESKNETKKKPQLKITPARPAKKTPSTWSKWTSGTKKFFSRMGKA